MIGPARWQSVGVAHDVQRSDLATRADIELLVRAFYRDAAVDELLGPVFEAAPIDWPSHIERITDFWVWQLLGGERYERNPLLAHRPVHERTPFTDAHYQRWLGLFADTVDDSFEGPIAEAAKTRATKMANALQRLLAGQSGDGAAATEVRVGGAQPAPDER